MRRALLKAGPVGVTAVDFLAPNVIDYGPPITRVAARIEELRKDGLPIQSGGERDSCRVYILRAVQLPTGPPAPVSAPPTVEPAPALFEVAAATRSPYSIYDDERAA